MIDKKLIIASVISLFFSIFILVDYTSSEVVAEENVILDDQEVNKQIKDVVEKVVKDETIQAVLNEENVQPIFEAKKIDDRVYGRINNSSYRPNNHINLDDLRYLTISHYGFDDAVHYGEMIVHKSVAEELLDIFEELYTHKFPIERMELVDNFGADDLVSMQNNNTSAFNYRPITGSSQLSNHAYGLAIDINPLQNPYHYKDKVLPEEGQEFLDRASYHKGMILEGDVCYEAFVSRGWTWGGDWKSLKDYQHFEKKLTE